MPYNWIDISIPVYTGMVHWLDNTPVRVDYLPIKLTGSGGEPARAILRKMGGEE
jgi:kynurenine formamidase